MALANVACLLARRCPVDRGVLMVDWSLESPSLHRFFRSHTSDPAKLDQLPGLLDLFTELDSRIPASGSTVTSTRDVIAAVGPGRFPIPTDIPALSLLKAGRFDADY